VRLVALQPLYFFRSIQHPGAYILSALEESSRDPAQNAGFVIHWTSERQETRVTSYAVRNSVDIPPSSPSTPSTKATFGPLSGADSPAETPVPPQPLRRASTLSNTRATLTRQGSVALSKLLTRTAPNELGEATFAAFKALPVDPTRSRQLGVSAADELVGATTCADAVDIIVSAIRDACADAGNTREDFVKEEDVVRCEITPPSCTTGLTLFTAW
jgi:hypothetical protein